MSGNFVMRQLPFAIFRSGQTYEEVITSLQTLSNKKNVTKVPCYAHMLQLVIKDAINSSETVKLLIKDVKSLKKFFHASPYWYDKFKALAGKGLVNQADTRWNTVNYVFNRLKEPKVQDALDKVLAETRKSKTACKISFSKGDYEKLKVISDLLAPLTDLTNELQSDQVTSSLVIPGLSFAHSSIMDVHVGDDEELREFRLQLCKSLEFRFGSVNCEEESSSNNQKIRDLVFSNTKLIISSILDPRLKTSPFKDTETSGDVLNAGTCSQSSAVQILHQEFKEFGKKHQIVSLSQNSKDVDTPRVIIFQCFNNLKFRGNA
ncbi:unnamed protein product [Allacma fusca]|uniref:Uncharacterized protein n=1 Tax=Allacma fusca TaxID=39272 RepID=A0A8J2LMM7_9HEXA|nr:unnamed protein product [Allacma fusca]